MVRKFEIEINEEDLKIIDMALQDLPYRVAKGVLDRLNAELVRFQTLKGEQEK